MKNLLFLAIVSILFVSCGGEVEQAPVSDSAAVAVDTVVVVPVAPVADPSEVEKLKEAKEELKAKREADKEEPLEVK